MDVTLSLAYDSPEEVGRLFSEYTGMLLAENPDFQVYLDIQNYEDEVLHLEKKYGLPAGRLYIARCGGRAAGCVALRKIDDETCEMKRLYVRPAFRGCQIGSRLIQQIIDDARATGYRHMLLDTLPFLKSAIHLYRQFDFYEIPCYNDSPIETTIFMKLDL